MQHNFNLAKLCLVTGAISLLMYGCGKGNAADKKDVVAYVNRDAIYRSDIKRDIALRAKLDPTFKVTPDSENEQLDVIIERKLIIQSAMEKGLAREERFVNAIRTIWEQTLIRDFIDYMRRGLQEYLFATDDDIKRYYDNMSYKVTFKVFKTRDKHRRDEAYRAYLSGKDTSAWQTIGPVGYDDILSGTLLDAFEMGEGKAGIFDDEPNYYIVEVALKEKADIEPLEKLKPEIEKRAIAMKERRLFEDWLKDIKKKSKIKINKEFLK